MKLKSSVLLIATAALLIAIAPAMAAQETSSQGQFTIGNQPPTITDIELLDSNGNNIDGTQGPMTPQQEFKVHVTANDLNGGDDITWVVVYIYYATNTNDEPSGTTNVQTEAIYEWTNTEGWKDNMAGSTWVLVTDDCSNTTSGTQAEWVFAFKPGKVAKEADGESGFWIIKVRVQDGSGYDEKKNDVENGNSVIRYKMSWYGEISTTDTSFSFEDVSLGTSNNEIRDPTDKNVDLTAIANGNYKIQVKAADTSGSYDYWVGQSYGDHATIVTSDPGTEEIRLKVDDDSNHDSGVVVIYPQSSGYNDWLTSLSGPTEESGANHGAYLLLDLGDNGLQDDTYVGKVFFQIANS